MRVVLLASEWESNRGGESTFNRELAIQLAKHPEVREVVVFLPRCDEGEKQAALSNNVTLVQAKRKPGFDDETDWLSFPPEELHFDVVVGHGVELGRHALNIRDRCQCKWVQFVHSDPEEQGILEGSSDAISKGEKKRLTEVELCVMADFVVAVGPKLAEAYRSSLRYCGKDQRVFVFTPGIFSEFSDVKRGPVNGSKCQVLVFGRGGAKDFSLKGYDIAAKAVTRESYAQLIFACVSENQRENFADSLKLCGIPRRQLRLRSCVESRESLKNLFFEADVVIMPSRTDGFGLAALEALSSGLPVLVNANSGFGEALAEVPFGSVYVVNSEEDKVWAAKIKEVWGKGKEIRLEEARTIRDNYACKYSWERQCADLLHEMIVICNGPGPRLEDPTGQGNVSSVGIQQKNQMATVNKDQPLPDALPTCPPPLSLRRERTSARQLAIQSCKMSKAGLQVSERQSAIPLCLPNNLKWDKHIGKCIRTESRRSHLYVVEEALEKLRMIKGPVCVVSIAGACRKGKSYLLSELFDQPNVFPLGHALDPETMGIWLWIVPGTFKDSSDQEFTVVLLDSEGTDCASAEGLNDNQIFTLTVLLASVVIYNSVGVPTRSDLDGMEYPF